MSKEQGAYLDVVDFDNLFQMTSTDAIFVNDFDVNTVDGKQRLNDMLHVRYEGDTLDILPSCDCGEITGQYNVGVRCSNCRSEVMSVTERPLESVLWFRLPRGVKAFVNPAIWVILSKAFRKSGFNLIEYLTNPTVRATKGATVALRRLKPYNLSRGLNYFVENFDEIMDVLFRANPMERSLHDRDILEEFIKRNRDRVFCSYIPIPSRLTFIVENTATGTYADSTMRGAFDAIRTITSIESSALPVSQRVRELRTAKAIAQLADYYNTFIKVSLATKKGWIRKHVLGSRLHFTFRAVISSLSDNHDYDELHLPWSMSVMVFKHHLISKMLKMGYTPNETVGILNENTLKYHPLIDHLFKELISETVDGRGFPVLLSRNPTLQRGSVQRMRVTQIKTDPTINTIGISVLCLAAPNADFDGDELNGMLILDARTNERCNRLAPYHSVLDLQKPRTLSRNVAIPQPVLATMGRWIHEDL